MDLGVGDVFAAVGFGCWAGEHAFEGFHFFILFSSSFFSSLASLLVERGFVCTVWLTCSVCSFSPFNAVLAGGAVSVTVASAVAAS